MDVIEKAARALAGWTPNVTRWEDVCHDPKDAKALQASYRNNVRAVLLAIREPGKKVIDAGITAAENVEDWTQDSFERYRVDSASDMPLPVFQAMIDAALECPATPAS